VGDTDVIFTVADDVRTDAEVVHTTVDEFRGLTAVEVTEAAESRTKSDGHPRMLPSAPNFKTQTSTSTMGSLFTPATT
jgi:hypothetical protein